MEGLQGKADMAPIADWEPEEIAGIAGPERQEPPSEELTYFAGQTMTAETADRVAFSASHEGMGI